FRVRQGREVVAEINMPGEWLAWNDSAPIKKSYGIRDQLPIEIEQYFSWQTSPIKFVNAVEIPGSKDCTRFNSHRTPNVQLHPGKQFGAKEGGAAPPPPPPGGGAGGGGPGLSGGFAGGSPGPGGGGSGGPPGGAASSDDSKTPNGIVRKRYLSVTDQVRH